MTRKDLFQAAGILLAAGLAGCSMHSGDPLPTQTLAGDAKVTLLQTTDVHDAACGSGHVAKGLPAAEGSYARIAAYVDHVRGTATNPVILVDSGDWSMGTLYDLTLGSQPAPLYFMDALRYNCTTLGNHEFDYTPVGLALTLKAAQTSFSFHTPIVASNMNLNGDKDLAPFFGEGRAIQASHVEVLPNGLKVGYLGLLGRAAYATAPAAGPVTFTDFATNYALVQKVVDRLRDTEKCHIVVALSHTGADTTGLTGEDVELARHVTGIDVIASGHNHNPLPGAVSVVNGAWTSRIICAGAYGTHVARIDLTYHADSKRTTLDASESPAMTDAGLAAVHPGLAADPAYAFITGNYDSQLNAGLKDLFTKIAQFPDYDATDVGKGIYHPVGAALQPMVSNDKNPVLCPNGMGNLCADAVRGVPNAILSRALLAAGWNGLPGDPTLAVAAGRLQAAGMDPNPFLLGVTATGVIRGAFPAGVALTFADLYNTLPLGTSPDTGQAIPIGYPLMSAYLDLADLQKVCALQLVAQTNLAPSDYYLNLSGIRYALKPDETYTYFKHATAAGVLSIASAKAAAGSVPAGQAMAALGSLATDHGTALLALMAGGNAYATAMASLNDTTPGQGQIAVNLGTLGTVATAAASGSATLSALVVGKAVAAIGTVSAFDPADPACTGGAAALPLPSPSPARVRVAADLYAILMMGAAQSQFGVAISAYKAPTGATILSTADMPGLLGNRIDLDPSGAGLQEVKEWMALLLYLTTPPTLGGHFTNGTITAEYASTALFTDFGAFGPGVQTRAATYPIQDIGRIMQTLGTLQAAP